MKSKVRRKIEQIVEGLDSERIVVFTDGYDTKEGRRWRMKFGMRRKPFSQEEIDQIMQIPGVRKVTYAGTGHYYQGNIYNGPVVLFDRRPKSIEV